MARTNLVSGGGGGGLAAADIDTLAELNTVVTDADFDAAGTARPPNGAAGGDLGGSYPNPTVTQARGLRETTGPTTLALSTIADAEILFRSGSTIDGKAIGTGASTIAAGDDSRFTDSRAPSGAASGDLGGTYPSPTVVRASGAWAFTGDISPTALAGGSTDDYAPTGHATAAIIRQDASVDSTITGLAGGADGREVRIFNISAASVLTFVHDATSTVGNRFICPGLGNMLIRPGGCAIFTYDATTSRWRATSRTLSFGTTAGAATEGNDARVPTQAENDALVGTSGAPSTSNKYVTEADPRLTSYVFGTGVDGALTFSAANLTKVLFYPTTAVVSGASVKPISGTAFAIIRASTSFTVNGSCVLDATGFGPGGVAGGLGGAGDSATAAVGATTTANTQTNLVDTTTGVGGAGGGLGTSGGAATAGGVGAVGPHVHAGGTGGGGGGGGGGTGNASSGRIGGAATTAALVVSSSHRYPRMTLVPEALLQSNVNSFNHGTSTTGLNIGAAGGGGGGGGSGDEVGGGAGGNGGAGGDGGGGFFIASPTITVNGSIKANGGTGVNGSNGANAVTTGGGGGGGGGGAGGGGGLILLRAHAYSGGMTLEANGGAGGTGGNAGTGTGVFTAAAAGAAGGQGAAGIVSQMTL